MLKAGTESLLYRVQIKQLSTRYQQKYLNPHNVLHIESTPEKYSHEVANSLAITLTYLCSACVDRYNCMLTGACMQNGEELQHGACTAR